MKKRVILYALMLTSCLVFAACGTSDDQASAEDNSSVAEDEDAAQDDTEAEVSTEEENAPSEAENVASQNDAEESAPIDNLFDDDSIYFVVIDGQKFNVGDKVSDIAAIGYDLLGADNSLKAGEYDSGSMALPGDNIPQFFLSVYNPSDATIQYSESVLGGFKISFGSSDENAPDIEVYGGIRIGSTRAEAEAVFGIPDKITHENSYSFRSSDYEKSYRISFDENDLVNMINWTNVTYNQ